MRFSRILVAAGLFLALTPPVPADAATRTVTIPDHTYSPERIVIVVGETVRWVNESNDRHSVTATTDSASKGENFDSNPRCDAALLFNRCMRPGESYSHTFTTRGTFTYYCRRHGRDAAYPDCGMCGKVTVVRRASPTIAPTTPGSASPTTSGSPSASPSPTVSPSVEATSSGSSVAAPKPGDSGTTSTLAIAALGVVLLGATGYLVYRSMIRR